MEFDLRPWRMEDAETIARYANNPKVAANLRDDFPHPYTQRDAAAFIQSCLDADPARCCFRAIAVNGETVGSISLSIGEDISSKSAELGYWLAEPYWGQGIMPEAVRQICGFAFQTYGLARIFAVPFAYNLASRRVLEKAGFQQEGLMRNSVYKRGMLYDSYLYARTSQDGPAHDPDRTDREEHASSRLK